jgi:hypothetical protein
MERYFQGTLSGYSCGAAAGPLSWVDEQRGLMILSCSQKDVLLGKKANLNIATPNMGLLDPNDLLLKEGYSQLVFSARLNFGDSRGSVMPPCVLLKYRIE